MSRVSGMEDSPTFHVAMAIELIDASLPFPERWEPNNIRHAKVIDAAPYRRDQFNWDTVPTWGEMEKRLFGRSWRTVQVRRRDQSSVGVCDCRPATRRLDAAPTIVNAEEPIEAFRRV